MLIAWLLLRVVYLVNGAISQALANREREEALADIVADLACELGQRPRRRTLWPMPRLPPRRHPALNVTFDAGARHGAMMNV